MRGSILWICIVGFGLSVVLMVIGAFVDHPKYDHAIVKREAQLEEHCTFERLELSENLHWLFSTDSHKRSIAAMAYEDLNHVDWREVAVCVPRDADFRTGCGDGDVGCMAWGDLNALRWMAIR